jgi:ATP-dependent Lon protease
MLRMPDGNTTVIIQGKKRFEMKEVVQQEPYLKATIVPFEETRPSKTEKEFLALVASLKDLALQIIQKSPNIPSEAAFAIKNIESPSFLINFISSNMNASSAEKQQMLEVPSLKDRATMVLTHLTKDLQMLELKNQIQDKVKVDLDKQQRDYFLHQQIKTIQEELGEKSHEQDFEELSQWVEQTKFDRLGVFTYSHEENTHAFSMKDDVPARTKKQRANAIMEIQSEISLKKNQEKVGQEMKVLIDRKEGEYFIGRTEFDSPEVDNEVIIHAPDQYLRLGDFVDTVITDAEQYDLFAELKS